MIYLETSRLQLRDWVETDLEPFSRLNADEEVMRYFLIPYQTKKHLCSIIQLYPSLRNVNFDYIPWKKRKIKSLLGLSGHHGPNFKHVKSAWHHRESRLYQALFWSTVYPVLDIRFKFVLLKNR